ncbi:MAG: hypothetical protein CSA22_04505 [Deltaproteobacteria bacterium]|nr:MAG: hypothetical protein CSA22_04505 [Deltaproteobacteria bacterium]
MDYKVMAASFGLVFLAELGDKTQLAALCLAAESQSRVSVFSGSAAALVLASFLAVFFGDLLARLIPPFYIRIGAGLFFVAAGLMILFTAVQASKI